MQSIPNSSAMDVAARGGGPSSVVLPWIITSEPQQVLQYAADLAQRLARLVAIVEQVGDSGRALQAAWSGSAADGAQDKIGKLLALFQRISQAVGTLETENQAAAAALQTVQQGYRSVVGAVNPAVASLLATPYTRPAATALATSSTAKLAAFVSTTRTTLDQIGLVRMTAVASALVTIATELDKLLSHDQPS